MDTTLFGNVKPEAHQAVLDELEQLRGDNARLDQDKRWAQEEASRQGIIDSVATMARRAVLTAEEEGGEVDQLAALLLVEQVVDPIKKQRVKEIVERLKEKRFKGAQNEVDDPDWVANESEIQDRMLEQSGAYGAIDEEVRNSKVAGIKKQLVAQRIIKIDEQFATPEAIEQATLEAERLAQPELEIYRRQRETQLPHELKKQAVLAGQQEIDDGLDAKLAANIEPAIKQWRDSYEGAEYRRRQEQKYRKELDNAAKNGGQAQIDGEMHARQEIFDTYLKDFEQGGIDFDSIPEGTAVTIALGEVKRIKNPEYDFYNRDRIPEYKYVLQADSKRVMVLIRSKGTGMFYVRNDSLGREKNPYLRTQSLTRKIISVGRHVDDQSNGKTGIEHKISKGDVPSFDENTTSPDIFIDGELPVANISVAGVPAIKKHADVLSQD